MTRNGPRATAGLKHDLCQVATAVLKPIERAMQPWINGPRRTRRTQHTSTVIPPMLDAFFGASLLGLGAATLACDGAVMHRSVEYDFNIFTVGSRITDVCRGP